jgi:hypothetical protein
VMQEIQQRIRQTSPELRARGEAQQDEATSEESVAVTQD